MKLLFSLLVVLCLQLSARAEASNPLTAVKRTPHFIIHYRPDMEATASTIGDSAEDWLREIATRLDAKELLQPPIPLFLYSNQKEFRDGTGMDRPQMVLGQASSLGYVDLDASGVFAPAERVAGHEITHVVIFRILGDRPDSLPLWANEGTAKYMTKDWAGADQDLLMDAIVSGSVMPLDTISQRFPEGDQSLAYAEGTSAIRYFVGNYGERSLAKLIHETGRTGSFEEAMRNVAHQPVSQFEKSWRASLEVSFSTARVLRYGRLVVAFGWPLLVLAAYLAYRRRRRRVIEGYERDEWEEANWRDWGGR